MTWQADRSASIEMTEKQSMTKVQFGRRNNQKNMVDTIEDFSYEKPMKKIEEKKSNLKSVSNKTANTFDTFQSQDSMNYKLTKKNASSKQGSSFLSQETNEWTLEQE